MNLRVLFSGLLLSIFAFLIFLSCTEKYPPSPVDELALASESSCVNCHFNKERLKDVATPIEHQAESGEG